MVSGRAGPRWGLLFPLVPPHLCAAARPGPPRPLGAAAAFPESSRRRLGRAGPGPGVGKAGPEGEVGAGGGKAGPGGRLWGRGGGAVGPAEGWGGEGRA